MTTPVSSTTPIIGEAPAFVAMLEEVSRVAPLSKPVLIIGERGTGKELVATRLHYLSPRWDAPLIKLNCSALTESLLESELFGHEAGSFTGAARQHIGRFERADGGTLLLDELATIPMRMQEKILRVIEYGEFERVGGAETIQVDVRILGATNADLPQLAQAGLFRADLLDRLAFDVVNLPPLRQRIEDILPLAEHFAINMVRELEREFFPGFTEECQRSLLAYAWPGNVRGLKNAVERSVYRSDDPEAQIERIVFDPFSTSIWQPKADSQIDASEPERPVLEDEVADDAVPADLKSRVAALEIQLVDDAMRAARFRQPRAAELLGLSYNQLRSLLKKHKLVGRYGRRRNTVQTSRARS